MAKKGQSHSDPDGPRALAKTSSMADFRLIELRKKLQVIQMTHERGDDERKKIRKLQNQDN